MATDAQVVYLVQLEHPLIGGTVRGMTDRAALEFGFVLVDKWSLLLGVALVADLVIAVGPAKLVRLETTMRIVAIAALQ